MSRACDLGEAKTMGHGQRIAKLALAGAKTLGAKGPESGGDTNHVLSDLVIASLLHDIGISSVTYNLYERLRGQERALLRVYPSGMDALLAAWGSKEGEVLHFILERHAEIGAGMVRHLGYGEGVVSLLEGHHQQKGGQGGQGERGDSIWGEVLTACDLLETWVGGVVDAGWEARVSAFLEKQSHPGTKGDVWRALKHLLNEGVMRACWGEGGLEEALDGFWGAQHSAWVGPQELETHLRLLAQVVDAQSPFTAGHTLDVTRLARRMGEHLGLGSEELDLLSLAGLIHGVGRLGLPASIIEKSGGLSDEEFTTLHRYPNLTREALNPIEPLRELVDAASTHREKLDGSGYPEGRTEGEIPLIGRILAVADTYNALISDRPYRSGYGRGRALSILRAEGTRLFDGLAIDALETVCKEGF